MADTKDDLSEDRKDYPGELLLKAIDFIDKHYERATEKDAQQYLTTEELTRKICDHLCITVHPHVIYDILNEDLNFTYTEMGDIGFVWLMKVR